MVLHTAAVIHTAQQAPDLLPTRALSGLQTTAQTSVLGIQGLHIAPPQVI